MWIAATLGGVAGCLAVLLPMALVLLISAFSSGSYAWWGMAMTLLWPVLYLVISVSTLAGMIKGIRL
jgi:hypothetical protein